MSTIGVQTTAAITHFSPPIFCTCVYICYLVSPGSICDFIIWSWLVRKHQKIQQLLRVLPISLHKANSQIKFAFKPLLINRTYCWEPCQ